MIDFAHGNVTEKHVQRCAKMSGPFGRYLDIMFTDAEIVSMKTPTRKQADDVYKQEVALFVNENEGSGLFEYLPFRQHKGFEGFDNQDVLRNPKNLGKKLKALSVRMDAQRRSVKLCTDSHL